MNKKRKTGRKLLSFLLTLAMVVGLMPGMGLTAYAEGGTEVTQANVICQQYSYGDAGDYSSGSLYDTPPVEITNITLDDAQAFGAAVTCPTTYWVVVYAKDGDNLKWTSNGKTGEQTSNPCTTSQRVLSAWCELYNDDVFHFGGNYDPYRTVTFYFSKGLATVGVTGVSLDNTTAQTIDKDGKVSFTATVSPDNATDKTVKWSVGGTNTGAVKLYTDEACTAEVGADATDKLTVYAKGESAGSATITATSNADSEKKASCDVTVNAAQTQTETLLTTITPTGQTTYSETTSGVVTVSHNNDDYLRRYGWLWSRATDTLTVSGCEGYTITKVIFKQNAKSPVTDSSAPFELHFKDGRCQENQEENQDGVTSIDVYGYANKTAQTITASDVTATYGDTDKSVNASVTTPATGGGAISYTVKDGSGDYIDVASDGKLTIKKVPPTDGKAYVIVKAAATDDYAETTKEVTVTISKAEATVAAKDQSIMVDGTVPDLSAPVLDTHYSVTGLVGTDTLTTAPTLVYQKNGSTATPDSATAGTYDIVPSGASAGDNYNISYTNGTLTISEKQPATVTKAPTANTLTYNGQAQALVTSGEATGGEMQYALGTATEATQPYTTSIPTANDAGTYYIWYKVSGDANHNDSEEKCVTVTIAPVDKTELSAAIKVAEDYYDTIKDNADYSEQAKILSDAITAAKKLVVNDNANVSDVNAGITAINTTKTTVEKDVKNIANKKAFDTAKKEAQAAMNEQVTVTQNGKKITVKWTKSTAADGYDVYVQYCGKKATKPAMTIKKNTTTKASITKINDKKLDLKKQFKVYVAAYKMIDGEKVVLGKSDVGHIVGVKNSKYTNVKSINLVKSKYTIKVGKTTKIKAKITLVDKNKKHISKAHGAKFRYRSSDTSIATVDKNGKIKGIKKGTCTIYVYAINGLMKKAKVTVK